MTCVIFFAFLDVKCRATRNSVGCTQARKTTHGLDGQHQDMDRTYRGRVNQNDRTEINGEGTSMAWPTVGPRTAKERNSHAGTFEQAVVFDKVQRI